MNKKEVIEKIEKLKGLTIKEKNLILDIEMISKGDVLEIISQIDESQKVVVPQFVADWLEVCKENLGFGLSNAMSHSTSAMNKQPNWVKRWFNFKDNQETFAKAWLFGYEVEKEKLYTVEIPNPNSKGNNKIYLCKDDITGKIYLCKGNFNPSKNRNLRLTESEIKQDFEWAWQFAKEVEE
ncbi:hypothetical protein Si044o_01678 [Streptococcus infantarius subsp. infantarius]|nr:hypothetical protein [Streptococcus infantarius subsp. infantarius]